MKEMFVALLLVGIMAVTIEAKVAVRSPHIPEFKLVEEARDMKEQRVKIPDTPLMFRADLLFLLFGKPPHTRVESENDKITKLIFLWELDEGLIFETGAFVFANRFLLEQGVASCDLTLEDLFAREHADRERLAENIKATSRLVHNVLYTNDLYINGSSWIAIVGK